MILCPKICTYKKRHKPYVQEYIVCSSRSIKFKTLFTAEREASFCCCCDAGFFSQALCIAFGHFFKLKSFDRKSNLNQYYVHSTTEKKNCRTKSWKYDISLFNVRYCWCCSCCCIPHNIRLRSKWQLPIIRKGITKCDSRCGRQLRSLFF